MERFCRRKVDRAKIHHLIKVFGMGDNLGSAGALFKSLPKTLFYIQLHIWV